MKRYRMLSRNADKENENGKKETDMYLVYLQFDVINKNLLT